MECTYVTVGNFLEQIRPFTFELVVFKALRSCLNMYLLYPISVVDWVVLLRKIYQVG